MSIRRLLLFLLCLAGAWALAAIDIPAAAQDAKPESPRVLVAVHLRSPDFAVRDMKYRVFYNKMERKTIPLTEYDFGAALADELTAVLGEDKRWRWQVPTSEESLFLASYFDVKNKQGSLPSSVKAERLLLVDVKEYGAMTSGLAADKFFIRAELRLLDRASGRQLWKKGMWERIDLNSKVDELQADNQKGLKQGINDVLEKFARRAKEKMAGAGL